MLLHSLFMAFRTLLCAECALFPPVCGIISAARFLTAPYLAEMDKAGKYKNLFDCFNKIAKAEGIGALYRGLPAVSCRGCFANASSFPGFSSYRCKDKELKTHHQMLVCRTSSASCLRRPSSWRVTTSSVSTSRSDVVLKMVVRAILSYPGNTTGVFLSHMQALQVSRSTGQTLATRTLHIHLTLHSSWLPSCLFLRARSTCS